MRRHLPLVGRYAIDALVIAFAVFAQLEIFVGEAAGPKLLLVPAALLFTLPLLLRRRFPFGVLVVVMGHGRRRVVLRAGGCEGLH